MITAVYPCTMDLQSTMKNTVILPRYVQKTIFYVECFDQTFSLASHLTIEQLQSFSLLFCIYFLRQVQLNSAPFNVDYSTFLVEL